MDIHELIETCGFDATGECPSSLLKTRPEVRAMCAVDRCNAYGRNWACPPACGEIEDFQQQISQRTTCYVVQTCGDLEDSFDFETMVEVEMLQKERFEKLNDLVKERFPDALMLSAGTCQICKECTCPDAACRFPERRLSSMEAAGLVVSEVCTQAGVPYNHGPNTMSYTGCIVL
jgi:predicted metal-binding protein